MHPKQIAVTAKVAQAQSIRATIGDAASLAADDGGEHRGKDGAARNHRRRDRRKEVRDSDRPFASGQPEANRHTTKVLPKAKPAATPTGRRQADQNLRRC